MTRFLIFTVLFPPLVPLVYMAADPVLLRNPPGIGFLTWLMGYAYVLAIVPAWLTAGVDWALSRQPLYVRVIATMPVAAILAELVARSLGQPGFDVTTALMGAIPAALCSLILALAERRESVTNSGKSA